MSAYSRNSFLQLLFDREMDYTSIRNTNRNKFLNASIELAEYRLVYNFKIRNITPVRPEVTPTYDMSCNSQGHAAISHRNRNITIVDTKRMVKIQELNSIDRTIWTIAYHPNIPSLLATGTANGLTTVYENYISKATIREECPLFTEAISNIPSICFHPKRDFVLYSSRKYVRIWDWRNLKILYTCSTYSLIRFMQFNPLNNMLITVQTYREYDAGNCISDFLNVIGTISLILNSALEPNYIKDIITSLVKKLRTIPSECQLKCESQNFLNERNFDRMINDFTMTVRIWHQQLKNFAPENLEVNDLGCNNLFYRIKNCLQGCNKVDDENKSRLLNCMMEGERPVKVALQMCLKNSSELQFERVRPPTPGIVQVWDFDTTLDLREGWHASICQCEFSNYSPVDVSKCGNRMAIFCRMVYHQQNNSRLRVFSLERHNLGQLLYNIYLHLDLRDDFIGVTFSPSGNYLVITIRDFTKKQHSRISAHRLLKNNVDENVVTNFFSDRSVGSVKWAPNPGDEILLASSTHNVSYWSYN